MAKSLITVILAVKNEAKNIGPFLQCIRSQTYGCENFDIIIVDNGSTDHTMSEIKKNSAGLNIQILEERTVFSPDAARNKALPVSRGSIIAFTDADCRPDSEWLHHGELNFRDDQTSLVAGQVIFTNEKNSLSGIYDSLNFLQHDISVALRRVAFTCNLFVHRRVFQAIPQFPVVGGWNGDSVFTKKATDLGFRLVYSSNAMICHPARDFRELFQKVYRIGFGQGQNIWNPNEKSQKFRWRGFYSSKPHILNLNPFFLNRRLSHKKATLGWFRFLLLWNFSFIVVAFGGLSLICGYIKGLQIRFYDRQTRILKSDL